jgi:DNA-binding transcriptional MerR regulator
MSDSGFPLAALPERVVLDGWKEIAFHFGVTARTVQMWEAERGLPVHRKPGPKGRVYAYADELQAWNLIHSSTGLESDIPIQALVSEGDSEDRLDLNRAEMTAAMIGEPPEDVSAAQHANAKPGFPLGWLSLARGWPARSWVTVSLVLFLVASGSAWVVRQQARKALVSVKVSEWSLQGLDDQGKVLWTYRWEEPAFRPYRATDDPPHPVVADLDGDGENEVYLWHESQRLDKHSVRNATLLSFDAGGQLRWQFAPDATLRTSYREFPPPYSGRTVRSVRYDGGRKRGVLAVANHHMNYPSRVMLFSAEGTLLREYLHSGHLHLFLVEDFNQDGREEIYVAGVANDYEAVDLTVLDPDTMHGASAEPRRQLLGAKGGPGVKRGTELRRLVLPRTYLSKVVDPFSTIGELRREGQSLILSAVEGWSELNGSPSTFFEFDRNLRIVSAGVSENFESSWEMLRKQGKLDRAYREGDLDVLKDVRDVTGGQELRASE